MGEGARAPLPVRTSPSRTPRSGAVRRTIYFLFIGGILPHASATMAADVQDPPDVSTHQLNLDGVLVGHLARTSPFLNRWSAAAYWPTGTRTRSPYGMATSSTA